MHIFVRMRIPISSQRTGLCYLRYKSDSLPQATGHDSEKKFRPPEAWRNKFATLPKDIPTLEILLQVGTDEAIPSVFYHPSALRHHHCGIPAAGKFR